MKRMGIVWRDNPQDPHSVVKDMVLRTVRDGTLAELVDAAVVSGLDGDLVDTDGSFAGRILSTPGLVPLILLTHSP